MNENKNRHCWDGSGVLPERRSGHTRHLWGDGGRIPFAVVMKTSAYKNYDDLPLFLNASLVAQVLGVSPSSGYELMHVVVTTHSPRPDPPAGASSFLDPTAFSSTLARSAVPSILASLPR